MKRLTTEELELKAIERLETTVRREPGVRVKRNKTNGKHCLHLVKDGEGTRGSYTIYTAADWESHPWNGIAQKERKTASREAREAHGSNR